MNIQQKAMVDFAQFALNFEHDFIQKAFTGTASEWLIHHFESKFKGLYDKYKATGVFVMFWSELDIENRKIMADYIIKKYETVSKPADPDYVQLAGLIQADKLNNCDNHKNE